MTSESGGLLPSLSIKVMVDRRPSVNIVAMPFFTSTDSWNFFENPFKTRVDPFDPVDHVIEYNTIRKKLAEASGNPFVCGFGHFGDKLDDGTAITNVRIPYELEFAGLETFSANKAINQTTGEQRMWYDQLRNRISSGNTVLKIWATPAPGVDKIDIGDIVLSSDLHTSVWGD